MIKNIIFDYGNVIFDINHQLTIQAFQELGLPQDAAFFGHLQQNPLFDQFEMGNISAQEFRDAVRKITSSNFSDQTIDNAWNTLLLGIRPGYLDYLTELKSQFRTFLLSNNNEIHYNWINNYLMQDFKVPNMSSFFEKDYYSHLMGMRKPNADIFEYVIETHQLNVKETLFIDDSPQHIVTAAKLGLHTHLMLKEEDLRSLIPKLIV
jgi:FMN phosphatase YigB (HAD superfamily)